MAEDYLDFDLSLAQTVSGYRISVVGSPAGEATAKLRLPFEEGELENLIFNLAGKTRKRSSNRDEHEMQIDPEKFGGDLFDALFTGEIRDCLRSSLDEARRAECGLRIRLRFVDAPLLAEIPWELLYHSARQRFLALSNGTPIVRFLELPEPPAPFPVEPPIRILVMISSPYGYPHLNAEREYQKLRESLFSMERNGLVTLDKLPDGSLETLRQHLHKGYHIFHFVGHGEFDADEQCGQIILEDRDTNGSHRVSAVRLSGVLHNARSLRLAVLNSCEGARSSKGDPFSGTAQRLVQQGLPAVVAMQFEISDKSAIAFAAALYGALADDFPVDAAVTEARVAVLNSGDSAEWATPVLYMRSPDGRIFDLRPPPVAKRLKRFLEQHSTAIIIVALTAALIVSVILVIPYVTVDHQSAPRQVAPQSVATATPPKIGPSEGGPPKTAKAGASEVNPASEPSRRGQVIQPIPLDGFLNKPTSASPDLESQRDGEIERRKKELDEFRRTK